MDVTYHCFEAVAPGTAPEAHVRGIVDNCSRWRTHLIAAPDGGLLSRMLRNYWAALLLRKPDVAYVRGHPAALVLMTIYRFKRVPVITEVNGHFTDAFAQHPGVRWAGHVLAGVSRYAMRRSTGIIAVTEGLRDWIQDNAPGTPVVVVPCGVDCTQFAPLQAQRERRNRQEAIIFFGSLVEWQGIDLLLEAVRHQDWPRGVTLTIVGAGPKESAVVKAAALDGSPIRFLGHRPRDELIRIIQNHAAAVSPKTYQLESRVKTGVLPFKVVEALASGTPMIVTPVPEQDRLVRDGCCGVIAKKVDAQSLAMATATVLGADEATWGSWSQNGLSLAGASDWARRAEQTALFVENLVTKRDSK